MKGVILPKGRPAVELIEWTLEVFAPYGDLGLFAVSFMESSFFPIPPDVLLIPLTLLRPQWGLWLALVTTTASVLGALFGYYIGARGGRPLLERLVSPRRLVEVESLFQRYGAWAVGVAGFTPIPYKVFTIAAGVFHLNRRIFVVASVASRGLRFGLEAVLVMLYGEEIVRFLTGYFDLATLALTLAVLAGYGLYWLWRRSRAGERK
ncbi:MAG: YqaA family protein [Bacillota bacterium]|nr:YqaA family protein [Bacillota bacterium]